MRKRLWIYLVLMVVSLTAGYVIRQSMTSRGVVRAEGITMLPATVKVSKEMEDSVANALLGTYAERGISVYAITDVDHRGEFSVVSVAGLPDDAAQMQLESALWLGSVTVADTTGMPAVVNDVPAAGEYGGSGPVLPFRDGTQAMYGFLGVHGCGFGLGSSWVAVDLFPTENMVYASEAGSVSYVCRDGTQVSMRVGNQLYAHLVDTGQVMGDTYSQGQAIAGMVPGTFTATCGNATQSENNFHVHFCLVPVSGAWSADGYTLDINSSQWVKGEEIVDPTEYLTAAWENANVPPPGSPVGGNFWDALMGGVSEMVDTVANQLPVHEDMSMRTKVMDAARPSFELISLVFFSSFDMTVPLWMFGIITAMELIRVIYAGWMWVKRAIPIIG